MKCISSLLKALIWGAFIFMTINMSIGHGIAQNQFFISHLFFVKDLGDRNKKTGGWVPEREVSVDINPHSCTNPINISTTGVLSAVIIGTEDFDVTKVDVSTIKLEGLSPLRSSLEVVATAFETSTGKDVSYCTEEGPDEFLDLVLEFDTQKLVKAIEKNFLKVNDGDQLVLNLTGKLLDGTPIWGEDLVVIVKKGKR